MCSFSDFGSDKLQSLHITKLVLASSQKIVHVSKGVFVLCQCGRLFSLVLAYFVRSGMDVAQAAICSDWHSTTALARLSSAVSIFLCYVLKL
ncbi:hypothetical protein J3F84DRAFT_369162 [Trichoderma pleuroticola]